MVVVASTLKLSMMPSGDKMNAGVDWTVTCGGNPVTGSVTNGACGTLAPAHTTDGGATLYTAPSVIPIGTTVTITATLTSNPSQISTMSLTTIATPIAVSFTNASSLPASLDVNTTTTFQYQVTNDPLAAGVIWTASCGSSACGSFNPTASNPRVSTSTTYTAPSAVPTGGAVTIMATSATDTSKSASATLTITTPTPPPGITVSVLPASLYVQTVGSAHMAHLTALVANDTAAGGVDWSVSCGASKCGSITSHTASEAAATYTSPHAAPPNGTVTITANSTTNPAVSATATANIVTAAPIVVTMSTAPPASLTAASQATLAAKVASDSSNLGVNWTASCGAAGACGSFNLSPAHTASSGQIVYTAPASVPAGGVVTITASSPASTPSNPAIAFTTITAQPPSVAFTQAPPASMTAATQASVIATVTNDVAPGGVTWSVQCSSTVPGDCGWISPAQTASGATAIYTAPPVIAAGTQVTITAASVASPSVSISSNPVSIAPNTTPSVSFIPSLPAQIQPNGAVNLTAAVANDTTNAGINWQVCASGCGFFTTKPAQPAIPATATTPYVPPVAAVTATSVSGWSNGLPIPYTAPSEPPSSGSVVILASAHADSTKATSGTIAINTASGRPALSGVVQAGTQPVVGGSVALFAAGTSGYASAAGQIAAATTDAKGNFTVPAGYTCPSPASQMYLVATGGKVGTNTANPNLALMTALGSCSNLGSTPVIVNEITTIASAFATAPFAANDVLTGNNSYLYLGASSGNSSGLANAFATVNNMVDITTGQARFRTPAGNAAVPYVEINTLADTLNACTATSGGIEGDGSACGTLLAATDVVLLHTLYNSVAPTDTLQAAFNIAQHPVSNYGYQLDAGVNPNQILGLAASSSVFQPILTAQPNDWSLSLNYTGGGGLSTASTVGSFAIDATGNLWITDTANNSVIEWNGVGAAISPSTGFPAGGGPIAVDASGNLWISGDGALAELTSLGSAATGSPFGGVPGGGSDMAIDAQGNLWIANGGGVSEFSSLGVAISPVKGFTFDGLAQIDAVGVDSSNNIWLGDQDTVNNVGNFSELTNPGGNLIVTGPGGALPRFPEIAADNKGDLWAVDAGGNTCEVPPYGGKGTTLIANCYSFLSSTNPVSTYNPRGIALDGAGTVWIASQGGGTQPVIAPGILPLIPGELSNTTSGPPTYLASPSLAAGPLRVAVDSSGNVWVLLADNSVTEFAGVATPVVTPVALGVKNNKLAAKP